MFFNSILINSTEKYISDIKKTCAPWRIYLFNRLIFSYIGTITDFSISISKDFNFTISSSFKPSFI